MVLVTFSDSPLIQTVFFIAFLIGFSIFYESFWEKKQTPKPRGSYWKQQLLTRILGLLFFYTFLEEVRCNRLLFNTCLKVLTVYVSWREHLQVALFLCKNQRFVNGCGPRYTPREVSGSSALAFSAGLPCFLTADNHVATGWWRARAIRCWGYCKRR